MPVSCSLDHALFCSKRGRFTKYRSVVRLRSELRLSSSVVSVLLIFACPYINMILFWEPGKQLRPATGIRVEQR